MTKRITSRENTIYKNAIKLNKRKYRDEMGKYLIEGPKPVEDAIKAGLDLDTIFINEMIADGDKAYENSSQAVILSADLFDKLVDTQTSQGVVAVANKRNASFDEIAELVREGDKSLLILDRLQDPGNVGTMIRTAEAAGMAAVLLMQGTCDVYLPKVCRAAAGSLLRIPLLEIDDERQAVELLHEAGLRLAVTALEGAADYRETELGGCGIVIGNEGQGVSDDFLALADIKVKIPMQGEIESLNAAVAAGILMYAAGKVK